MKSTFIEIVNPRKSNIIVGVIYRQPSEDLADFNCNYLNKLLENTSKEQKSILLLGDFNDNLLNYNEHNETNDFLDSCASNSFIPLILQPTRITSHSNTFIDNIFSNVIDSDIVSGNLIATISDHWVNNDIYIYVYIYIYCLFLFAQKTKMQPGFTSTKDLV